MGNYGKIRGGAIKDESIESADIASGSIKAGEVSPEIISGQPPFYSGVDMFNDMFLILDTSTNTLKQMPPYVLSSQIPSPYFFVDQSDNPLFKDQVMSTGSFSFSNPATVPLSIGSDVYFYVSGTIGERQHPSTGTAVFGGDAVFSGTLFAGEGVGGTSLISYGNVGVGTETPTSILTLNGTNPTISFKEGDSDRVEIGVNDSDNLVIENKSTNRHVVFKVNDEGTVREALRLDGGVSEVVVNDGESSLVDFRVASVNQANMFFVDGSANRIGIGTSSPQNIIDIIDPLDGSGQEADAVIRLRSKRDVGIKLIADIAGTIGEADNPFIHFYQDGQTDTSGDGNRLVELAMEGNANTAFTDSIANAFYIDAYCPNSTPTNTRTIQIANDSQNNGHAARITIEGDYGYVGIHTNDPEAELHVLGQTILGGNVSITTSSADLNVIMSGDQNVTLGLVADTDNAGGEDQNPRLYMSQETSTPGAYQFLMGLEGTAGLTYTGSYTNQPFILALDSEAHNSLRTFQIATSDGGEVSSRFSIATGGRIAIGDGVQSADARLHITEDSTAWDALRLESTVNGATAAPVLKLKRRTGAPATGDYMGQLEFEGFNDSSDEIEYAKITSKISDVTLGQEDGTLEFYVAKNGTPTKVFDINNDSVSITGDANISGQITAATQPAFLARKPSNNQEQFVVDSGVDVTLSTEDFDVGSNFASNTFTAPTTGVYIFTANIYLTNLDTDANSYSLDLVTTAGTYRLATVDPGGFSNDLTQYILGGSIPVSLAAGDTAKIQVYQSGGTQQTNIRGAATRGTFFAGYLLG